MHLSKAQCQQLLPASRADLIKSCSDVSVEFSITDDAGILIFESGNKSFIAPYVKEKGLRRAGSKDGVTARLLSKAMPDQLRSTIPIGTYSRERFISVDQSNESVVLDESVIVKWQLTAQKSLGAHKEEVLKDNNFAYFPELLGNIYWQDKLIASANKFISGTPDGWSWCVNKAKENDLGEWLDNLAVLTSQMHRCLEGLIHGDFHVGQILKTPESDQLWVIDFEGDPLATEEQSSDVLRDVASMCASFFHVGAVAIKYGADPVMIREWIMKAESLFTSRYFDGKAFDIAALHAHMLALETRELKYADKFLPQWRYAPEFAIAYMKELGYGSN
jgi:predicted trehalose synthase